MYSRSFQDVDGHLWEAIWMDQSAIDQQLSATTASPVTGAFLTRKDDACRTSWPYPQRR